MNGSARRQRARARRGVLHPNGHPPRPGRRGALTLPAESPGPMPPAAVRPVTEVEMAATALLARLGRRDPGQLLDIPAALRTEVFRLPPLAKAGRIELAQSRLRLGAPTLEERLKDDQ